MKIYVLTLVGASLLAITASSIAQNSSGTTAPQQRHFGQDVVTVGMSMRDSGPTEKRVLSTAPVVSRSSNGLLSTTTPSGFPPQVKTPDSFDGNDS